MTFPQHPDILTPARPLTHTPLSYTPLSHTWTATPSYPPEHPYTVHQPIYLHLGAPSPIHSPAIHTFPCTSTHLQTWTPTYLVLTHLQIHTPRHLAPLGPHTGHTLTLTYWTLSHLAPSCLPLSATELGICTPTSGYLHTWTSAHP